MNKTGKILAGTAIGIAGAGIYWTLTRSRALVEQASYAVRRRDGKFELRDYPAMKVATTPFSDLDRTFKRLFNFIQGENAHTTKIAMTVPVFIDRDPGDQKMSFVMPEEQQVSPIPRPVDPSVTIAERPASAAAVYRFSGRATESDLMKALNTLRDWMSGQGLEPGGPPVVALYDSPMILPFLRRNEVMFPLATR